MVLERLWRGVGSVDCLMNATDINRIRKVASSPFWWMRFWTLRRFTLDLCCELEKARMALEFEPKADHRILVMELERERAEKLKHKTSVMKLLQFIHVHNRVGQMKPIQTP